MGFMLVVLTGAVRTNRPPKISLLTTYFYFLRLIFTALILFYFEYLQVVGMHA
jgi:hypothetical protein